MPSEETKSPDYKPINSAAKKNGSGKTDKSLTKLSGNFESKSGKSVKSLENSKRKTKIKKEAVPAVFGETTGTASFFLDENESKRSNSSEIKLKTGTEKLEELPYAEQQKIRKKEKKAERDWKLLSKDHWLARNGHSLTYISLYFFSILVLFRPYEIIPALSFLSGKAFYSAALTLALFLPTQLLTEGNFTKLSTEVKAVLGLVFLAIVTMPIAKSFGTAWEAFNEVFIKAVAMFVVMVNVLRTRARLLGMVWLSLLIGLYLSFTAIGMYFRGELTAEGYRVAVNIGGMFGNPNDMAMHLVMMIPLAITLGIVAKKLWHKFACFAMAGLFTAAITVTYSRGGFIALIAMSGVLIWKLGRKDRLKISIIASFAGLIFVLLAPGNYGERILSIFNPSLDAVGSSGQRRELLYRSILVSLRNPWGIGIGNFPIVGVRNLGTHNSYTQISSELGLVGLALYLTFILSPLRKLFAVQRRLFEKKELNWFYYLSIGFQASIIGYMVSSFFAAVAYNWYIYYLIAYAVAFRRIYQLGLQEEKKFK